MREGDPDRRKAKQRGTVAVGGGRKGSDLGKEKMPVNQCGFEGLLLFVLPCIVAGADEKKLLVFLKAQEAGVRGESGGERGEEAVRAATQLSNISNQTERRHLRHSCETARKKGLYFTLFVSDYSRLDNFGRGDFCSSFYHRMRSRNIHSL